ncbi:glycosyltransferase [Flavobacterium sp.]|jgi:glycosyltransferase involved in cell wall biosynthesis|uniref:glycosyltransferase n=1 Tax=Flavobacterium sp. TaxID=239 RepID=UPI0037C0C569
MKKKILFVIPSLDAGGAEKSLINLLNAMDYSLFDVTVLVFHGKGIFLKSIPKSVKLITVYGDFLYFSESIFTSVCEFLKQGKFTLAIHRIFFFLKNKIEKNTSKAEQVSWKHLSKAIPELKEEYDAAIGALEKSSIYYVVEKVKAKTKIGWIHTNYSNSGMQKDFDLPFFERLNYMVTISEECKDDLNFNFPNIKDKIKVIHNIVSPKLIKELSEEKIVDSKFDTTALSILTIARLSKEKGIDFALEAALQLVKMGKYFKWYIIGEGDERVYLETKIKEYQLENSFILLGLKDNPYPYVKQSFLYVQPSRYEGKSLAIDEAKILSKPIITTNYPTAKDQIDHGVNGIICEMNPMALAQQILALTENPNLIEKFIFNLKEMNLSTETEITNFYKLIYGTA